MSPQLIGAIGFIVLFGLLAIGMPIGFAMAAVAITGLITIDSVTSTLTQLQLVPYSQAASYVFSTIPLFVLMGSMAFNSGVVTGTYKAANKWFGSLPGGLAMATIGGCAGFAACTGSSMASVGVMAKMALPEMLRYKYHPELATGCVAGGTTLGILIPPSIPMIVYGMLAQASVGQLFIAGILPGVLFACLFCLTIYILVKWKPSLGPPGPKATWRERLYSLSSIWPTIIIAGMVLGGIWGGMFTPIEAGGIGAFCVLIVALIQGQLTKKGFFDSLNSTMNITCMMFVMLIGAMLFNYFLAVTRLPAIMADYVGALPFPPVIVLILMMVFYLIGGCIMDSLGLMMLTLPIFIPICKAIGIDLILFGVVTTIQVEMALITPPIGMNVFVLGGMAEDIPMYTIFRGILPFLFAMIVGMALIIAFPQIALFLPSTMIN